MERYKRIQTICWCIVAIAFLGLAVWLIMGVSRNGSYNIISSTQLLNLNGPFKEVGRYHMDISEIDSIDVSWVAGEIKVTPYSGDDIEIIEYAQRELDEEEVVIFDVVGSRFTIHYCEENSFFVNFLPPKKLELFIPEKLASNLQEISINTVSSSSQISDFTVKKFQVTSVSGDVTISGIKTEDMELQATSGNFELTNVAAPKAFVKTVSGDLGVVDMVSDDFTMNTTSGNSVMESMNSKEMFFKSVSGDLTMDGTFRELSGNTTSGNFYVTEEIIPEGFQFKTVSGDVNLTIPESNDINLFYDTVSGDIESDILVRTEATGDESFIIRTTSGNVMIDTVN